MSVKERLKTYLNFKNIYVTAFEKSIKVSNGYVNGINKTIGSDKRDLIVKEYPDLNIDWLLNGKGEMLIQEKQSITSTDGLYNEFEIKNPRDNVDSFIKDSYEKLINYKDAFLNNVLKENERLRKDLDFERSKNNKS